MAVIIVSLLLALGPVWADHLPMKTLHNISETANQSDSAELADVLPVKLYQNISELTYENDSNVWIGLLSEEISENNSDITNESVSSVLKDLLAGSPHQDINETTNKSTSTLGTNLLSVKTHQDNENIAYERAASVWTNQLPVKSDVHSPSDLIYQHDSWCKSPFEQVGSNCYYFSDIQHSFNDALDYCESLSDGHTHEISLAMLDYQLVEDRAIMDSVAAKNKTFWIGGKTEDAINWKWIDNRIIYLQSTFWYNDEPNDADHKCLVAQSATYKDFTRSYLFDYDCSKNLNFICQTFCPLNFRQIGSHCYFVSEELGIDPLPWQDARDYCQTLSVTVGYHSDLAMLGLPDQDDIHLLSNLFVGVTGHITWMGGYAETDCVYKWIDGRSIHTSSLYNWDYDEPDCGSHDRICLYHHSKHNRTYLNDYRHYEAESFICQMFKNA